GWNAVAGKGLPGGWILNGASAAEVSGNLSRCRDNRSARARRLYDPPVLVRQEQEQLVFLERPTHRSAEVVVAVLGLYCREEIPPVHLVISKEFKEGTVN